MQAEEGRSAVMPSVMPSAPREGGGSGSGRRVEVAASGLAPDAAVTPSPAPEARASGDAELAGEGAAPPGRRPGPGPLLIGAVAAAVLAAIGAVVLWLLLGPWK
jgi:hypothetical protein